jgi:hypothetical protein
MRAIEGVNAARDQPGVMVFSPILISEGAGFIRESGKSRRDSSAFSRDPPGPRTGSAAVMFAGGRRFIFVMADGRWYKKP